MSVSSVISLVLQGEDNASSVLESVSGGLGNVGNVLAGLATVGGVVAVVSSVVSELSAMADMAGAVESSLGRLQTRTGATTDELEEYRDMAFDIRTSGLGESFEDVADSLGSVQAITDLTGEELEDVTGKAMVLSDVFDADVVESARAADTAMENFGISGQKTFDLLVAGFQETGDPAGDLLDTVNEYAADFAEAGFSAEGFFSVLVAGADAGVFNLDKVADAVREFSTRVVDNSVPTRAALDDIGIGVDNLYDAFATGDVTVAESLGLVIDHLRAIEDPIARDTAGVALFGSMWEDLGQAAIFALGDTEGALGDYRGAADEAFATATSGLEATAAKSDALKEKFKVLLGEAVLPLKQGFYELGIAILDPVVENMERMDVLEDIDRQAGPVIDDLLALADGSNQLQSALTGAADGTEAMYEAIDAINSVFHPFSGNVATNESRVRSLESALVLLEAGFTGTGRELGELAVLMATEAGPAVEALHERELGLAGGLRDRTDATSAAVTETGELVASTEAANAASDIATETAARVAEAERRRAEAVADSQRAIASLHGEMGRGFDQSLGILEAGDELQTLNSIIYESAQASGAGAVELATLQLAMGDTGEQAVIDALKFELLKQGVSNLAAAFLDGSITATELKEQAGQLQSTLDEEFTFAFVSEGADGVLELADEIVSELDAAVAKEYGITVAANVEDAELPISDVKRELLAFEDIFSVVMEAQTDEAETDLTDLKDQALAIDEAIYQVAFEDNTDEIDTNVAELDTAVHALTGQVYDLEMGDNAAASEGHVGSLQGALNNLVGRTYTIDINADTSGVPDWAIPHSPLPIHTAWEDYLNFMDGNAITPTLNAPGAGGPLSSGSQVGAGVHVVYEFAPNSVVIHDQVTGQIFLEWLRSQSLDQALSEF